MAEVVKSFLHKLAYINRLKDEICLLSLPCGLMREISASHLPLLCLGNSQTFGKISSKVSDG